MSESATKEIRHELSERQFRALAETQGKLAMVKQQLAQIEGEAKQAVELVFDAHGIGPDAQVSFDEATRSLVEVVEIPLEEETQAPSRPRRVRDK